MKRFIVVLCVVGLLAALTFSHEAFAGKKKPIKVKLPKVDICHITASTPLMIGGTLVIGHVINVSENAIPAHLDHGDVLDFDDIDNPGPWETWRELAEWYGLNTKGADCAAHLP